MCVNQNYLLHLDISNTSPPENSCWLRLHRQLWERSPCHFLTKRFIFPWSLQESVHRWLVHQLKTCVFLPAASSRWPCLPPRLGLNNGALRRPAPALSSTWRRTKNHLFNFMCALYCHVNVLWGQHIRPHRLFWTVDLWRIKNKRESSTDRLFIHKPKTVWKDAKERKIKWPTPTRSSWERKKIYDSVIFSVEVSGAWDSP